MCERDVPPFVIVEGNRARVRALNRIGLERRGFTPDEILALKEAFRALFVQRETPLLVAAGRLDQAAAGAHPLVRRLVAAVLSSSR